jgi:hypothetical protein
VTRVEVRVRKRWVRARGTARWSLKRRVKRVRRVRVRAYDATGARSRVVRRRVR